MYIVDVFRRVHEITGYAKRVGWFSLQAQMSVQAFVCVMVWFVYTVSVCFCCVLFSLHTVSAVGASDAAPLSAVLDALRTLQRRVSGLTLPLDGCLSA